MTESKSKPRRHLKLIIFAFNVLWTALLIGAYNWIITADKDDILKLAENEARASFKKDLVYRRWVAGHGGVYVPVTKDTPPNPLMEDIRERDITTSSGRKLTLINPDYMTRQIIELSEKQIRIKGHLTSLNSARPENEPDEWEKNAFKEFEKGKEQVTSVELIDSEPYFRYMGRLIAEDRCLKCHASQGYQAGDILGAISTFVPLSPFYQISSKHVTGYSVELFFIWLLGLLLFNFGTITLRRQIQLQEKTEKSLRESEERWRTIVQSEPECVKLLDRDGRLLDMNPAGLAMIEATIDQVRGARVRKLVAPQDRANFDAMIASVFRGETASLVFNAHGLSGKPLILETKSVPLWDESEKHTVKQLLGVTRDITESKNAENSLRELEERFRLAFYTSPDALNINKMDGTYLEINEGFTQLTGYTSEDVIGKTSADIHIWDVPEDRQRLLEGLQRDGFVRNLESRFLMKDGTHKIALMSAVIIKLKGEPHIFSIARDITDIKKSEMEKLKLEKRLLQAEKMEAIGTMAGGIAHDFNNILGIILGNAELAKIDISPDKSAKNNIDEILIAANRAKGLVKQILAFSRREECKKEPLYLCRLIDESMKSLRSTIPTSVQVIINISSKCREDATGCRLVLVDPIQVHQLLLNLCINAVHAMDEKGILKVSLNEVTFDEKIPANRAGITPGTYQYISVSDTGPGMRQEIIEQIFDPFFTTKEVGEGTGMGLSVVHGIIESHGGKIFVESELGKGTIFYIYFPVTEQMAALNKNEDTRPLPTGTERILFVDDEKMIATIAKDMIERQGYSVTAMTDSVEALALFQKNPEQFDLVITDQTMPRMTGAELTRQLLQLKPKLPVILCTGYSSKIDKVKAKQIGIRAFISKPLDREDILQLIRTVLDSS